MDSPPRAPLVDNAQSITRAATITSIGNFSSRVVGFVRDVVRGYYFGIGRESSAYEMAAILPNQFYDLLAGGMLGSALVPTFSTALSADETGQARAEFGRLLGALLGLMGALLGAVVALLWLAAGPIAALISDPAKQDPELVARLLRITIPAIVFLNLSGILTAVLQAQRRFNLTAYTATCFNLTMIALVVLLEGRLGISSMALGMVMGSMAQVLLQLPGLRGIPVRLSLNWRHPGIGRIFRLFLPVVGGLALQQVAVSISFVLAQRISEQGPAAMRFAANIIQLPLGLISAAIASATLPALSTFALRDRRQFAATLARGLRLVCVLIVPCVVALFVLAAPVVGVIYERNSFTQASTAYTAIALRAAIPNLFFAAMDRLLIFGFYARQNTRTPTLIGLFATVCYLLAVGALAVLDSAGLRSFMLFDLILADSLKTGLDMCLMGLLLWRSVRIDGGDLRGHGLGPLLMRVLVASAFMGLLMWLLLSGLSIKLGGVGFVAHALTVLGCGLGGAVTYVLVARMLGVQELHIRRRTSLS